jgi:hypothetical protein
MHSLLCTTVVVLVLMLALVQAQSFGEPQLVASFPFMNYTFRSQAETDAYFTSGAYRDVMPAGIKVSLTGDIYISVPRWMGATVPGTVRWRGNREICAFSHWSL